MNPSHASLAHTGWDVLYLACFGVGLALSIITFVGGTLHLRMGHTRTHGHIRGKRGTQTGQLAPVNAFTVVAFITWFGGTGYLVSHAGVLAPYAVVCLAATSGLAGAGLVFWFLTKMLLPRENALEPVDMPLVGVLGRVSTAVPSTGVGEMLYSQHGARRSLPVAADDSVPIPRGAEVVVLRYSRGIAFVRRWDEMQQSLLGDEPIRHGSGLDGN